MVSKTTNQSREAELLGRAMARLDAQLLSNLASRWHERFIAKPSELPQGQDLSNQGSTCESEAPSVRTSPSSR